MTPATQESKPVSAALQVPKSGKYAKVYQAALQAVDEVHSDGELPEIPVKTKGKMNALGSYAFYHDGRAKEISINGGGDHFELTMAHEIGHFIDHMGIGTPGSFATAAPVRAADKQPADVRLLVQAWDNAVKGSQATQSLLDKYNNPDNYAKEVTYTYGSGREHTYTTVPSKEHVRYLLRDDELWARSYAQYIATRSSNEAMKAQVAKELADPLYGERQWGEDDFAPIGAAIDDLFRGLGWRQ